MRIKYVTPFHFGDPTNDNRFDDLLVQVLSPAMSDGSELVVTHTPRVEGEPAHRVGPLTDLRLVDAVVEADAEGFDAFVIGCYFDPMLAKARELTDMPVIGTLEAATAWTRPFGHRYAVITDYPKAEPEISDRLGAYGQNGLCVAVDSVHLQGDEMLADISGTADRVVEVATRLLSTTTAEVIHLGCTIVGVAFELAATADEGLRGLPILPSTALSLKQAEALGDLRRRGMYRIGRTRYYARSGRESIRAASTRPSTPR